MRPTLPEAKRPASGRPPRIPVLLILGLVAVGGCRDNETAIARGDRLWADSSLTSGLAEYRLAVAQRGDEAALSRLAHAYAVTGKLPEARRTYSRLLEIAPGYRDQAAFDLLHLAERAAARRDRYTAAMAMEAALELRPSLQATGLVEIAEYHAELDDLEKALAFYRRALTVVPPDSAPPVLYEMGRLHEELGRCDIATDYFRAFREQGQGVGRWRVLLEEARWHTGSCAVRLAEQAREAGRVAGALEHLDTVIRLGVPENLLDQALFDRGELLLAVGEREEALESFRRVLERNPERAGSLVERARRRIDEIRFGDFRSITPDTGAADSRG